ncbi:MAG: hypothetical protein ACYST6_14115 [Planctomycetota bacterium]|jgi:hypothetical protein
MVHSYEINGVVVQTGDIICTTDAGEDFVVGQFWRFVGMLIPGAVDHVAVYVGPGGLCVEAGAKFRVVTFEVKNRVWNAYKMVRTRGPLIDTFYGAAYPLAGRRMAKKREVRIRKSIASYCLNQAKARKPYNLAFLNSKTEKAFYCSQLPYMAYLREGIDLNTGKGVPKIPGTASIIFPQEIWSGCRNQRAKKKVVV